MTSITATQIASANAIQQAATTAATHPDYTRQQRWHRTHLKTVSCKLTIAEAAELRSRCDRIHATPYSVLRTLILAYIAATP